MPRAIFAGPLCFAALLVLSTAAHAQYTGAGAQAPVTTVAAVLKDPVDDRPVVLQGKLLRQLKGDKYLFADATGEIRVEIDADKFPGTKVSDTTLIEIRGEIEKDFLQSPEIDVDRLTVVTP